MVDARKQKPAAVDVYLLSRVDIVIRFIIHSKYFPVSDWLKPHA